MKDLFGEKEIIENETKQVFLQGVNAGIHYMIQRNYGNSMIRLPGKFNQR